MGPDSPDYNACHMLPQRNLSSKTHQPLNNTRHLLASGTTFPHPPPILRPGLLAVAQSPNKQPKSSLIALPRAGETCNLARFFGFLIPIFGFLIPTTNPSSLFIFICFLCIGILLLSCMESACYPTITLVTKAASFMFLLLTDISIP